MQLASALVAMDCKGVVYLLRVLLGFSEHNMVITELNWK